MIKTRHYLVLAAFVIVIAIESTIHAMKNEKGVAPGFFPVRIR